MLTWEYATSPTTGTVHLTHPYGSQPTYRTLCGKLAGAMITGDETPYGAQVTCRSCRKVRAIQVDAQPGRIDRAVVDQLLTPAPEKPARVTDLAAVTGQLEDTPKFWAGPLADLAHHVRVERDRMAAAFAFCANNPNAPVQVSIRNLDALQAALDAACGASVQRVAS